MEFMVEHPLCVLQGLTALVSFAAGLLSYHFGWRRLARSRRPGSGGPVAAGRPVSPGARLRRQRRASGGAKPARSGALWKAAGDEGLLVA